MDNDKPNPPITIAIIDDDLARLISYANLRESDTVDDVLDRIEDETDPLYEQLRSALDSASSTSDTQAALVECINDANIRLMLPDEIQNLARAVEQSRESNAAPLGIIESWINKHFEGATIDKYASPQEYLESGTEHDLYLVDYLLVGDDHNKTKQFLQTLTRREGGNPPLFVLMSSHSDKLKDDFISLKSNLEMTSSRFRILQKPVNQAVEHEWVHTIESLVQERDLVSVLEQFIHKWSGRFAASAAKISSELWCMDAYALSMFLKAANDDGVSFYDYFSEIITRKAIAEIEFSDSPHQITLALEKQLRESDHITAGSEIQDSRETVRRLINEFCWHKDWLAVHSKYRFGDSFKGSDFSDADEDAEHHPFLWIKHQLNFGSVLRKPSGELLIHLTQPCDSARISYETRDSDYLFFLPGSLHPLNSEPESGTKESKTPSMSVGDDWANVHWRLGNPLSFSVSELMGEVGSLTLVGRVRSDLAQMVLMDYVHKVSRVGLIRIPDFLQATGIVRVSEVNSSDWRIVQELSVNAHLRKDKKWLIELEPRETSKLVGVCLEVGVAIDERILVQTFCKGLDHSADQVKDVIQGNVLQSIYLGQEVCRDESDFMRGLERVAETSGSKNQKKLNADPNRPQVMVVFSRI